MNTNDAESSLLILYAINKANIPLTKYDLSILMLDTLLLNYMDFTSTISHLKERGCILSDGTGSREYIEITEEGKKILSLLDKNLDSKKVEIIDNYLKKKRSTILNENSTQGKIVEGENGLYKVILNAFENKKEIIKIELEAPNLEKANIINKNWKGESDKVYQLLIDILLKDE